MSAAVNPVQVTASDRLGFSLFVAAILHAIFILGLGFGLPFVSDFDSASMLKVTMVLTKTHQKPTNAEHIASENQLASGSTDQENQPSSPFTGTSLNETNGLHLIKVVRLHPIHPRIANNTNNLSCKMNPRPMYP